MAVETPTGHIIVTSSQPFADKVAAVIRGDAVIVAKDSAATPP